jgi:hypothetical protein
MRFGWILVAPLVLTLGAAALPGAARADDTESEHDATDTNDDGVINRVEFNVLLIDIYYRADENRDGKLSRAELEKVEPGVFDAANVDKDDQLTLREYQNARRRDFEAADADNDGNVTLTEAEAFDSSLRPAGK